MTVFLAGCVSDTCPANYIVQKTDRVRCYTTETSASQLRCDVQRLLDINNNCAGVGLNREVSCPNACINSIKGE